LGEQITILPVASIRISTARLEAGLVNVSVPGLTVPRTGSKLNPPPATEVATTAPA
jgi:hypothetical protein